MTIARDVHSALKKAQQLCKLNPKVWEYLCEVFIRNMQLHLPDLSSYLRRHLTLPTVALKI